MSKRKAGRKPKAGKDDLFVGERVRHFRRQTGMTQEDLADAIGVTYQQVQKNEVGDNRLSAVRLMQIRKTLGVSIEVFVPEKYR